MIWPGHRAVSIATYSCSECSLTAMDIREGRYRPCVGAGLWPSDVPVPLRPIPARG